MAQPTNADIAALLDRIADLLAAQNTNPFRVRAYQEGAQTVRDSDQRLAELDNDQLQALPNIGEGLAAVIGEYVSSGKSTLLQDLEGEVSPAAVIATVPGIGQGLAERIVAQLKIKTLSELEEAAHDGRLAAVDGFGDKRIDGVKAALAGMLSRTAQRDQRARTTTKQEATAAKTADRPSVDLLLSIDEEYRRRAEAGDLPKIAPRRFNPQHEAWLPVLHAKRDGYDFTVLFSNTAQAHELDKTHDWVVIYYQRDEVERQHTVVTETKGPLQGKRVVRGRDTENRRYYQKSSTSQRKN